MKTKRDRKCEQHNHYRHTCKDCYDNNTGGAGICIHRVERRVCTTCHSEDPSKVSGICEHKMRKNRCHVCEGSARCSHKRRRDGCRLCRQGKANANASGTEESTSPSWRFGTVMASPIPYANHREELAQVCMLSSHPLSSHLMSSRLACRKFRNERSDAACFKPQ